jgi:hypothetical protein
MKVAKIWEILNQEMVLDSKVVAQSNLPVVPTMPLLDVPWVWTW